jgi:peroxiredoxin-like protein
MPTQVHEYPVVVNWTGGREGHGDITPAASAKTFPITVPPEFQGPGGETNPEELLTSAITGCYSITFGIVAANRKLPVVGTTVTAKGEVEQNGAQFKYRKITIMPEIRVAADASDEQIAQTADFAHKADAYCIVTNAVRQSVEVVIEPTVIRATA